MHPQPPPGISIKIYQKHPPTRLAAALAAFYDVVMLGRRPYMKWGFTEEDHRIVHEAMHRLGVEDMRGRFLNQLSGGEMLCLDCYEDYDRFDV